MRPRSLLAVRRFARVLFCFVLFFHANTVVDVGDIRCTYEPGLF